MAFFKIENSFFGNRKRKRKPLVVYYHQLTRNPIVFGQVQELKEHPINRFPKKNTASNLSNGVALKKF